MLMGTVTVMRHGRPRRPTCESCRQPTGQLSAAGMCRKCQWYVEEAERVERAVRMQQALEFCE